jgi:hypothetical protein
MLQIKAVRKLFKLAQTRALNMPARLIKELGWRTEDQIFFVHDDENQYIILSNDINKIVSLMNTNKPELVAALREMDPFGEIVNDDASADAVGETDETEKTTNTPGNPDDQQNRPTTD